MCACGKVAYRLHYASRQYACAQHIHMPNTIQSTYLRVAGETVQFRFLLALPPPPLGLSVGGGPGNEAGPAKIDVPVMPEEVEKKVVEAKKGEGGEVVEMKERVGEGGGGKEERGGIGRGRGGGRKWRKW